MVLLNPSADEQCADGGGGERGARSVYGLNALCKFEALIVKGQIDMILASERI